MMCWAASRVTVLMSGLGRTVKRLTRASATLATTGGSAQAANSVGPVRATLVILGPVANRTSTRAPARPARTAESAANELGQG
jgi:hypothetical protein